MEHRIGLGFDRHRLVAGDGFPLGGVRVPASQSVEAHSDGDVLLHALVDALLGATGQGDIGELFPPSEPRWKDADSAVFLEQTLRMIRPKWRIANIDATIFLEAPKLRGLKEDIVRSVATLCDLAEGIVNVKAKTGEGVGPVGEGLAVEAAVAVQLVNAHGESGGPLL